MAHTAIGDTSQSANNTPTSHGQSIFSTPTASSIASNPSAINIQTGTGALGRLLGIKDRSGIRIGGLWIANANNVFSGGVDGKSRLTGNNLVILDLYLDTNQLSLWRGGSFGAQILQFNGADTNGNAGTIQGYTNITALPPHNRTEIYQLWYRQTFFHEILAVRVGKSVPTYDFNNVFRSIPLINQRFNIPSVSGLLFTPIFVNSSMLGAMPGYYDSAYGITVTFTPNQVFYLSAGAYDGNLANGVHTGLTGPNINSYKFFIGEAGYAWTIGNNGKPGKLGVGAWDQTGSLTATSLSGQMIKQNGTQGIYVFGSQRLWYREPNVSNSGITGFFQYGINNSATLPMKEYFGLGLTAFALTRPNDSFGGGIALARLNRSQSERKNELISQVYYQAYVISGVFLEPAITYIPAPGSSPDIAPTWAGTLQMIALF